MPRGDVLLVLASNTFVEVLKFEVDLFWAIYMPGIT